jgi:hypothetical protein
MHWLYGAGLTSANKLPYLFWSGIGSILERLVELAVIGGILLRKHNCHSAGCPWIGRFPANEGNGWLYCRRHHATNGEQQ